VRDDLAVLRVDRADDRLRAEFACELAEQLRLLEGGAVDRDLVRARPQQGAGIVERRDAAADGKRDLELPAARSTSSTGGRRPSTVAVTSRNTSSSAPSSE
jgi:hypothetical protein